MSTIKTWDYLDEFVAALRKDLERGDAKWGDTWLARTKEGQEERTRLYYNDKFDQFEFAGTPINWLSIAGDAFICWIRENHPELWED